MSILYFSVPYALLLAIGEGINWRKLFGQKKRARRLIEGGINRYPDKH